MRPHYDLNEHLNPIFKIILPTIELARISYWVYGGVAVAGVKGHFIRENQDVDIFVLEPNYATVAHILKHLSIKLGWRVRETCYNGRPKLDLLSNIIDNDVFSLVPVYEIEREIKFICPGYKPKMLAKKSLAPQRRTLEGNTFFSLSSEVAKELFIHNLNYLVAVKKLARREDLRRKYAKDAEVLLDELEYQKYFGSVLGNWKT